MIRVAVALSSYLTGVWVLLVVICVLPGRALALTSPQAYARVVQEAEWIAYQASKRAATVATVGAAAAVESPAAVALRFVAGPVGWAALGVSAGAFLYQVYYSGQDTAALKDAAAPSGGWDIVSGSGAFQPFHVPMEAYNGQNAAWIQPVVGPCDSFYVGMVGPFNISFAQANADPTMLSWGDPKSGAGIYVCIPAARQPQATAATGSPTAQQVATYLDTLPASDPLSVENHTSKGGVGAQPQTAPTTQATPVSPEEMPTTVKSKAQVAPGDIVVADNVPPPAGTETSTPTTQQSTTTTTTVTNPDGSTTETKTTTASTFCTAPGGHEERTLGSILAEHQATWTNSGLLGAVNLLKTLTWPTALPVVELPSTLFGAQQVDFNQWAWAFTAIRTLVIAVASLAAYRLIFAGR